MVNRNAIYIFIAMYLVFFMVLIIKERQSVRRQRDKMVVSMAGGIDFSLINTVLWFVFFIIWSWLLIDDISRIYSSFYGVYIKSLIQLFDLEYLDSLREYFYDNMMLRELSTTVFYQSSIIKTLSWTAASGCIFALYFFRLRNGYAIYEDEIRTPGGRIKLDSILEYSWGPEDMDKGISELSINFKHTKFAARLLNQDTYEKKFKVKTAYKQKAEDFLKQVVKNTGV